MSFRTTSGIDTNMPTIEKVLRKKYNQNRDEKLLHFFQSVFYIHNKNSSLIFLKHCLLKYI